MGDDSWITESIIQFTRSPLWRTPVDNFVDEHCYIFTDDDEMKVEQTEVHLQFRRLIDTLLTSFVKDIGVTLESVFTAMHNSMDGATPAREPAEQFLDFIFYFDDFRSFHKMMVRRNIELDILASRALQHPSDNNNNNNNNNEVDLDEEEALKLAIAASLEEESATRARLRLEDVAIQEALALSIAAEEQRARRAAAALQESSLPTNNNNNNSSPTGPTAPAITSEEEEKAKVDKLTALEEERVQNIHKLEARALEVRKEAMMRGLTALEEVPATASPAKSEKPQSQKGNKEIVKPPETSGKTITPPRAFPHKGFGFKPLPSIQPSFKQLEATVAKTISPAPVKQSPVVTPAPAPAPAPAAPTIEEIEARARYMREQREKILQQNKANREKELQTYEATGGKTNTKQQSSLQEGEKQMTLDLARRLRDDILHEVRK